MNPSGESYSGFPLYVPEKKCFRFVHDTQCQAVSLHDRNEGFVHRNNTLLRKFSLFSGRGFCFEINIFTLE